MAFGAVVKGMAGDAAKSALGIVGKAQLIFASSGDAAPQTGKLGNVRAKLNSLTLPAAGAAGSHVMQVQYNPATLSLQASAESIPFQMLQDNINATIPNQQWRDPAVVLTVDLIFDDMNPTDAFMADKFMLLSGVSVGNLISAGAGIANAVAGKVYSVQKQTNALLAAAIRDKTRSVTFKWAGMSFSGEITEVNATYTMFSVSGRPVRSNVRLSITQQVSADDGNYWSSAFDRSFGTAGVAGISGGKSASSKVGNLLNFNY